MKSWDIPIDKSVYCVYCINTVMSADKNKKLWLPPISPAGQGPLYSQIVEGVKQAVNQRRLHPGDALPSFRMLAEELLVSVITVKRAYQELEHDGIIFRKQGLGTFVSQQGALRVRNVKREKTEALMREAIHEGMEAGLGKRELLRIAREVIQEQEKKQCAKRA